jgi:hypothetical protein
MQINNASIKSNSIYHDCLGLFGIDADNTTVLTTDFFFRSANEYNRKFGLLTWKNSNDWDFDDSNYTTLPIAKQNLVAGQEDYAIPSEALDIKTVSVLNSNGDYVRVRPFDESNVSIDLEEFFEKDGLPRYYRLINSSIKLYPAPAAADVTIINGLKVEVDRETEAFTTSDTTKAPGFRAEFHRYISYGVCMDLAVHRQLEDKEKKFTDKFEMEEKKAEYYYANRHKGFKKRIMPKHRERL